MRRLLSAVFVLCIVCSALYAQEQTNSQVFSEQYIKDHLQQIAKALPSLKAKMDKLKAKGQDISYPMVTYTVLDSFIGYVDEDATKGELERASMQLTDMGNMGRRLEKELNEALQGKRKFPSVPKWTGDSRPIIKDGSFYAPTTTFGKPGREIRPVFFTGWGVDDQYIDKYPGYGINLTGSETGPWEVFPEEGKTEDTPITRLKDRISKSQKAGVAYDLLISPHYFPAWVINKYPDLRTTNSEFIQYCLHDPDGQEFLKQYIEHILTPLKDNVNLFSICLSNEPKNEEIPCKYGAIDWHEWLQKKHGDINTLNSRWGTGYLSFDDIELPNPHDDNTKQPMTRWADYVRFNQEFFTGWHKMLADAVHAVAPGVPVHAKAQTYTLTEADAVKFGNDAYLLGQVTDISGNDSMCWYHFGKYAFANGWLTNAMNYDLQRSVKNAPIFNSENHIILDGETRYIPAEHVRAALWQQAVHGQCATEMWVWGRSFDKKSVAYGSIKSRPKCAEAVGIVNCDLNRAAKEVAALQQAPAQVQILHDTSALIYDGKPYTDSLDSVYSALFFTGVKTGFITERQLEDGIEPNAPVVCIPNAAHLSDGAFKTLQKYKGHVILIDSANLLTNNEYDKPRDERIAGDVIYCDKDDTISQKLSADIGSKLAAWNVLPEITPLTLDNKPAWGVEWKEATMGGGTVINLCNYLHEPVTVKLSRGGKNVNAVDVLTGENITKTITLNSLEVRLLKAKN
ncbi:MAG: beta-galactosidase [Armatimonadota bacterium]